MSDQRGAQGPLGTEPVVDRQTLATYRYLRMSLIAVLLLLMTAVLFQILVPEEHTVSGYKTPLESISAYYWTPVRPVFIGALMAMGVSMIVLKADYELEDILLNIGGVLAPVVALVPTPPPWLEDGSSCKTEDFPPGILDEIRNNVWALLTTGTLVIFLFGWLFFRNRLLLADRRRPDRNVYVARILGAAVAVVILFVGRYWFVTGDLLGFGFACSAHLSAAFTLFMCIVGVVAVNARRRTLRSSKNNTYSWLTLGMALVVGVGIGTAALWDYEILTMEALIIALFLVFWIVQSKELWNRVPTGTPTLLPSNDDGAGYPGEEEGSEVQGSEAPTGTQ